MQSPTAIAIRALVMLVCLITVPLLAIFGKNLPEVIQGVLEGRVTIHPRPAASDPAAVDAAPLFGGPMGPAPETMAPPFGSAPLNPVMPASASPSQPLEAAGGPPNPTSNIPVSFDAPVPTATPEQPASGDGATEPASPRPLTGAAPAPGSEPTPNSLAAPSTQFSANEQRLKDLGASYYVLETYGPQGDQYRFFCKIPLDSSGNFHRCFQAIQRQPLAAMEDVIRQIEQWQQQREP